MRGGGRRGAAIEPWALLTLASGELCGMGAIGDFAILFDLERLRRGVMRASADLPDRTGRETAFRAVGSEGSEATSR